MQLCPESRSACFHIQPSPKSSDFRYTSSTEAPWLGSWTAPQLVTETPQRKGVSETAGTNSYVYGDKPSGRWGFQNVARFYQQDVYSWTELIMQHVRSGRSRQALEIFGRMQEDGVKPSSLTYVAALKACSSLEDLERAEQIHAEVVESGLESSVYVGNMLVNVYAKCGSLLHARRVFETMPHRSVVSWNAMILGYARVKEGLEGLQLYARMLHESIAPNERTFVAVLKACCCLVSFKDGGGTNEMAVIQCLQHVRAVHSHILDSGFELDIFVGTMLVDVYAKCQSLMDARQIFERLPQRNVVSWTAMILGYAQMGQSEEALSLYGRMQEERVVPNDRTFVAALKACSSLAGFRDGNDADGMIMKKQCLERVYPIHAQIVKSACESDLFVGTMLVDVYAKCGSMLTARAIFDQMPSRNVVCWTAMILGYANRKQAEVSLQLYAQMQREGVEPDEHAFVGALKACCSLVAGAEGSDTDRKNMITSCLVKVRTIHSDVEKFGCESSLFVGNMLVDVYAKCGSLEDARHVFEKIPHRNVVSWNSMILGYAQMGKGEEALQLYSRMLQEGVTPDDRTFVGAVKACGSLTALPVGSTRMGTSVTRQCLELVRAIHSDIIKTGSASTVFVGNMLVDVYAKCGSLIEARCVFENIINRTVVSWNAMIMGYAQMEDGEEALRMYTRMQQESVVPDDVTFMGALKACSAVAALDRGKEIHARISSIGLKGAGSYLPATLIDMYGNCGSMVDAQQVFDSLATRDVVTWSALLAGYARHGDCEIVFDLFHKMGQDGVQPNNITFLSLLTVCSHVGLLDKGQRYFDAMKRDYGITPAIDHYTCLVDLLGRGGQVDKAMAIVRSMPFEPDRAVWQTVLGACRKWSKVDLGKEAFERAIMLDRDDAAAYVLMANIYAASNMWENVREVQTMRAGAGAWKEIGRSWSTIDGIVHTFVVGDHEHAET